jgi:hypothetical protein
MADDHLEYTNKNYRNSLIVTITILFLTNFYLLITGILLAIVPIILQGLLLVTMYLKWSEQRIVIKFWAGIIFISGISGLIAACARAVGNSLGDDRGQPIDPGQVAYSCVCVGIGIYYYVMLPRSTKIVEDIDQLG